MIRSNGLGWREAGDGCALISALEWGIRAFVYEKLNWDSQEESDWLRSKDEMVKYISRDCGTPFSELKNLMALLRDSARREQKVPIITYLNDSRTELQLGLARVNVDAVRSYVATEHVVLGRMMSQDLLLGLNVEGMEVDNLREDVQNNEPGYSFMAERQNGAERKYLCLIQQICAMQRLREHFFDSSDSVININARTYLTKVGLFVRRLLTLTHIVYGQPARASEMTSMTIRNTQSGLRSIHIHGSSIMIIIRASKTQNLTAKERTIARFCPEELSAIFINYIMLIRPFEEFLMQKLEIAVSEETRLSVWRDQLGAFGLEKISPAFKKYTSDLL